MQTTQPEVVVQGPSNMSYVLIVVPFILLVVYLLMKLYPRYLARSGQTPIKAPKKRGRPILIDDKAGGLFEVTGREEMGCGRFALDLHNGHYPLRQVYEEGEIVPMKTSQAISDHEPPVWVTKKTFNKLKGVDPSGDERYDNIKDELRKERKKRNEFQRKYAEIQGDFQGQVDRDIQRVKGLKEAEREIKKVGN